MSNKGKGKENNSKDKPVRIRFKDAANGRKAVYLYSCINGKVSREYLHLFILPEVDKAAVRANKRVIAEAERIVKERLLQLKMSATATPTRRAAAMAQKAEGRLLTDWLSEFYDMQKRHGVRNLDAVTRLKKYITLFNPAIRLKEIDKDYCRSFIAFLLSDYTTKDGKHIAPKTAFNQTGTLITALNAAVRQGLIPDNPMLKLTSSERIKLKETPRDFLTIEELKRLIATPCDNAEVKRAYLFACNTGLRISDIIKLQWKNITIDERGWILSTVMQKSTKPVYIPLGIEARRWLPNRNNALPEDKVFTLQAETIINEHLGRWARAAGITKHITFHTSRHTFATTLLTLDADIYVVSKLLGHANVRTTQRYAKIINKQKDEAVGLIDNFFV
ncbi:MAG: site-specific integrase [Prevotella sp.]|nr:site-specific integrase [Prevotella sp.]